MPGSIPLEKLERAWLTAAELLDRLGEPMRPIVDRLEREYLSAKAKPASEVDRVKQLIGAR